MQRRLVFLVLGAYPLLQFRASSRGAAEALPRRCAPMSADADEAESTSLSLLNEGVISLEGLPQISARPARLTSINLHCNRISTIGGLDHLGSCLTSLNLSSNRIQVMGGLCHLRRLETLDLSCNEISAIDDLAALGSLRRLLLSYNRISSLAGLLQSHGGPLEALEAYGNQISLLREAEYLRGLPRLGSLVLFRHGATNPVCGEPGCGPLAARSAGTGLARPPLPPSSQVPRPPRLSPAAAAHPRRRRHHRLPHHTRRRTHSPAAAAVSLAATDDDSFVVDRTNHPCHG